MLAVVVMLASGVFLLQLPNCYSIFTHGNAAAAAAMS